MKTRMTQGQFCEAIAADEIPADYRAGLRFASTLCVALERDLVEHNGYTGDVEPLRMLAAITRHLGSWNDA
jgi:hypothetical protein